MRAGLLLAAGRSQRFGAADKLTAPFRGRPLVAHAAGVLRTLALDRLWAVSARPAVDDALEGFSILRNLHPECGLGASLAMGAEAARSAGVAQLVVLLGDMPFVTADHVQAVVRRCTRDRASASSDGRLRLPPACFPAAWLETLTQLKGDQGARSLLGDLPHAAVIVADPSILADIDTPEALAHHAS